MDSGLEAAPVLGFSIRRHASTTLACPGVLSIDPLVSFPLRQNGSAKTAKTRFHKKQLRQKNRRRKETRRRKEVRFGQAVCRGDHQGGQVGPGAVHRSSRGGKV